MTSRTASALRKSTTPRKTNSKASASKADKLPEWNLSDLYSAIDAPEVTCDLDRLDAECVAFENDYKGKLAERTAGEDGGQWLAPRDDIAANFLKVNAPANFYAGTAPP